MGRGNGDLPKRRLSDDLFAGDGRSRQTSAEGIHAGRYPDRYDSGIP